MLLQEDAASTSLSLMILCRCKGMGGPWRSRWAKAYRSELAAKRAETALHRLCDDDAAPWSGACGSLVGCVFQNSLWSHVATFRAQSTCAHRYFSSIFAIVAFLIVRVVLRNLLDVLIPVQVHQDIVDEIHKLFPFHHPVIILVHCRHQRVHFPL